MDDFSDPIITTYRVDDYGVAGEYLELGVCHLGTAVSIAAFSTAFGDKMCVDTGEKSNKQDEDTEQGWGSPRALLTPLEP
jgi:hypothetical protein